MGIFGNLQSAYPPLESWFYDRYIASHVEHFMDGIYQQLRPLLQTLPADGRLLDVGCGGGQLLLRLAADYPRLKLVGIDLSPEQIGRARNRAKAKGLEQRISFIEGNAEALPFEANAFDLVISMGSIKHWPDAKKGLGECLRVLRPGDWLMIGETHRHCDSARLKTFFHEFGFPPVVRDVVFHTLKRRVFDRSPSSADLKQLFDGMAIDQLQVDPVVDMPIVLCKGRKAVQ